MKTVAVLTLAAVGGAALTVLIFGVINRFHK